MDIQLPYENVDFIPFGAPVSSDITNTAPKQIKANVEYLKSIHENLGPNPTIHSPTIPYAEGQLVVSPANHNWYRSLKDDNLADLADSSAWEFTGTNTYLEDRPYQIRRTNGNITLNDRELCYCDTFGVGKLSIGETKFTVALPQTPIEGFSVKLKDVRFNAQNYPVLLQSVDATIGNGIETELMLDYNGFDLEVYFNGDNWTVIGR